LEECRSHQGEATERQVGSASFGIRVTNRMEFYLNFPGAHDSLNPFNPGWHLVPTRGLCGAFVGVPQENYLGAATI